MKIQFIDRDVIRVHYNFVNEVLYLIEDYWDDYSYKTTFKVKYNDISLGTIRIGFIGMNAGRAINHFEALEMEMLPKDCFSLGNDENYYLKLNNMDERDAILTALRDIAYNRKLYRKVASEDVVRVSLMRSISDFTLRYQLNRIAHGGARLTPYSFSFSSVNDLDQTQPLKLDFNVLPDSTPPSNVHVLIGRNGTGKTYLLKKMIAGLLSKNEVYHFHTKTDSGKFANVLFVAFSPFDNFSSLDIDDSSIPYTYIGLDKEHENLLETICCQFADNFQDCMMQAEKRNRWLNAIDVLQYDSEFRQSPIIRHAREFKSNGKFTDSDIALTKKYFSELSSGHKVILLTITCCVAKLEERSLVFLDEPENHLHPPLLSAFIRALSELLIDRNGVAIISTHSPVVLQEVPRDCVWSLRRSGNSQLAERPRCETFGASIFTLTSEIFGLDVSASGFHRMLVEKVNDNPELGYDELYALFGGQLGDEACVLLRSLIAQRERDRGELN